MKERKKERKKNIRHKNVGLKERGIVYIYHLMVHDEKN